LLEKRGKQAVPAIVAPRAHRVPPTAHLAVEGITNRPNRESQTARKPACPPGFLAKSITCSRQIIANDQSLPHSSPTTRERALQAAAGCSRTGTAEHCTYTRSDVVRERTMRTPSDTCRTHAWRPNQPAWRRDIEKCQQGTPALDPRPY